MKIDINNLDEMMLIDRDPQSDFIETLETAGCTGGCESFKDGLPNCEECSQFNS